MQQEEVYHSQKDRAIVIPESPRTVRFVFVFVDQLLYILCNLHKWRCACVYSTGHFIRIASDDHDENDNDSQEDDDVQAGQSVSNVQQSVSFDSLSTYLPMYAIETILAVYNSNENKLLDDLCKAYGHNNRELTIYKVLLDELDILNAKDRQSVYDIMYVTYTRVFMRFHVFLLYHRLHETFEVKHLTVDNVLDLSKTFIHQLKLNDIINFDEYETIVIDKQLNGQKIMSFSNKSEFTTWPFNEMKISTAQLGKIWMQFNEEWEASETSIKCLQTYVEKTIQNNEQMIGVENYDCTQMSNVVGDICDALKWDDTIKNVFKDYFEKKPVDGKEFIQMKRKPFVNSVVMFDGKKTPKIRGLAMKIWEKMEECVSSNAKLEEEKEKHIREPSYEQFDSDSIWFDIHNVLKVNPKDNPYDIRSDKIKRIAANLTKEYGKTQLIDDLCIGYCDGVDNEACKLSKSLAGLIHYSSSEINRVYDIILHRYIQIEELNQNNFIKLCCEYIKQLKSYHVYISCASFQSIAEEKKMNGKKFGYIAKEFKSMKCGKAIGKMFEYIKKKWNKDDDDDDGYDEFFNHKIFHASAEEHLLPDIHESIFKESDDETFEILVDYAVRKVMGCPLWKHPDFVKQVYDDKAYYDAVRNIYDEFDGYQFF